MDGWIKLHRQITEIDLWEETPFDKARAWIDLLLMVNHKDKKILLGNESVLVKRGSLITSEKKLEKKWGWSKTKVRNFLEFLEKSEMILKKSDQKKTTLTIINYAVYQDSVNHESTTERPLKNHESTSEEPLKDRESTAKVPQKNTNKNDKKEKNEKKIDDARAKKELVDYCCQKLNKLSLSANESQIICQWKNDGADDDLIKRAIDKTLDKYKPKYTGDTISYLGYFDRVVHEMIALDNRPEPREADMPSGSNCHNQSQSRSKAKPMIKTLEMHGYRVEHNLSTNKYFVPELAVEFPDEETCKTLLEEQRSMIGKMNDG